MSLIIQSSTLNGLTSGTVNLHALPLPGHGFAHELLRDELYDALARLKVTGINANMGKQALLQAYGAWRERTGQDAKDVARKSEQLSRARQAVTDSGPEAA